MAASYYDEHNCVPLEDGEAAKIPLVHIARLMMEFTSPDEVSSFFSRMNITSPPAAKNFVKKLPTRLAPEDCDGECPICLKPYEEQEELKQLPCKHEFHSTCIIPWLEKTNTCPVCRCELPTDDESYELYRKQKKREKGREEDLKKLHNSMFS